MVNNSAHSQQTPKTRSTDKVFSEDVCFMILQFLEGEFILSSCVRISQQFLRAAHHVDLSISLTGRLERMERFQSMLKSSFVENLTEFNTSLVLKSESVKLLANCKLIKLKQMRLSGMFGQYGVSYLTSSPHLSKLKELTLDNCWIGANGVKSLASVEVFQLSKLSIARNGFGNEGIEHLISSGTSSRLTSLNISNNQIGCMGINSLVASPFVRNLTELDLSFNPIGFEGALAIASSPNLSKLKYLNVSHCRIGNEGLKAIRNSSNLNCLAEICSKCNTVREGEPNP